MGDHRPPQSPGDAVSPQALLNAAEAARAISDYGAALARYDEALERLRDGEAAPDPALEHRLLAGRATCYEQLGDLAAAEGALAEIAGLSRRLSEPEQRVAALNDLAALALRLGHSAAAIHAAEEALGIARQAANASMAACLDMLGRAYFASSDFVRARSCHTQALALHNRMGDRDGAALSLWRLGDTARMLNQSSQAQGYLAEALAIYRAAGDQAGEANVLYSLGVVHGDYARRRAYMEQALAIWRATGDRLGQSKAHNLLGMIYWSLGLYAKARAYAEQSVQILRDLHDPYLVNALDTLSRIYVELGKDDLAQAVADESLARAQVIGDRTLEGYRGICLGRAALRRGDAQTARELFEAACSCFGELGIPAHHAHALAWLGAAHLALGEWQSARQHTSEATAQLAAIDNASHEYPPQDVWWLHYQVLATAARQPPAGAPNASEILPQPPIARRAQQLPSDSAPTLPFFVAWEHGLHAEEFSESVRWAVLQRAREAMLSGIATLGDIGLRRNYLNKVAINREIVVEWARRAGAHGRAVDTHVWADSEAASAQEQLKRMLDISVRMNEPRQPEALLGFIMDELVELSGAERALLLLQEPSLGRQAADLAAEQIVVARGMDLNHVSAVQAWAADLIETVTRTRQPVLRQDLPDDMGAADSTTDSAGDLLRTRSVVGVPLVAGTRLIGTLYADMCVLFGRFDQSDIDQLTILATHAAAAIENARLYQATLRANRDLEQRVAERTAALEQRAAELATINRISQALARQLDLDALIGLVGEMVRETFAAHNVFVALYDREAGLIRFPYDVDRGQRTVGMALKFGEGLTSHIIQTRQPLLLDRAGLREHGERGVAPIGTPARSFLGVPILVGEQVIGVISVQNIEREGAYGEADARLLSTIAANVGAAIQNARLYQETRRRATEMAALAAIGQDIATATDLDTVLERITAQAKDLLLVRDIALFLWRPHERLLRARVVFGHYADEIKAASLSLGEGITGAVAESGVAEIINFPESDPRSLLIPGTPPHEEEAEALMCAPLRSRDTLIGLLVVWRERSEGLFVRAELEFLISLARQATIAIQNAQLYEETRRRATEMAALADVGRDISATLDLPMVLERIAAHAKGLLAADTSAVFLPDQDERVFRAVVVVGAYAAAIQSHTVVPGRGIIGDLAQRGVAEVIRDTRHDPRTVRIAGTSPEIEEQLMVAPLLAGAQVIGVMTLWRSGPRERFTQADLDFLVGLARQAAIAIENARLFAEAQQAKAAAETASMAKSTFLANMSHELRTPLNAVLGFAQLMERDASLSDRQKEHLAIISRSGEHLLGLINGVLEMSKIEAGRVTLNPAPLDLHALLRGAAELFRFRAEARRLQLTCAIDAGLPRYVIGDESKLRQILINLLGNAVKFTQAGAVTLRATWRHEGRKTKDERRTIKDGSSAVLRPSSLVVEVEDTGEGIAADQLPLLFEAFIQASSGAKAQEGTGLGLAITRQFVQLMGGTIDVRSAPGQGSVFTVTVPLALAAAADLADGTAARRVVGIAPECQGDYRILVVDDQWENRQLLIEWLRAAGFGVREAADGAAAIAIWQEWAPQLIWMDMRMPVLDGYEATRRIKATLAGQATVVIALTASAFEHEQASVRAAGCDDFVRKPVREAQVFEKIAQHLGLRFVYEEAQSGAAEPEPPALTQATLAGLPAEWRAALRQAALVADIEQVKLLIEQIRPRDTALADQLARLADDFQIDQLQMLAQ